MSESKCKDCGDVMYKCYTCNENVCENCVYWCGCGVVLCNDHAELCDICNADMCPECTEYCSNCQGPMCDHHIRECGDCGDSVCTMCILEDDICQRCVQ